MDKEPVLELKGISKRFGKFTANDNINLKIYPGEVHAVLGENGAGKSTLMNIIYGLYMPDEGEIYRNGKKVSIKSPKDAMKMGIGMVHQHYMLVDVFTSSENVFLIDDTPDWKPINQKAIEKSLKEVGEKFGLEVDTHSTVDKLTVGMQQRLEILKLLHIGADILILDEPTAVLAPQECDMLFETIEKLIAHGKSVVFISHKLDEVVKISDRITILSHGKVVGEMLRKEANKEKIVSMMVGEQVKAPQAVRVDAIDHGDVPLIELKDVTAKDDRGVETIHDLDFKLYKGEIVGIAGVEGNGQTELAEIMAGIRGIENGNIFLEGKEVKAGNCPAFIKEEVSYVPADRNSVGTIKTFPLFENWLLRSKKKTNKHHVVNYKELKEETKYGMEMYDVRARGVNDITGNLSGGNLQKFILAREMTKKPKSMICEYPTRGVDIKASWFIRENILHARDSGMGVVLISGDLEELFFLSDIIFVMYKGKIIGQADPKTATVQEIGNLMMGITAEE